MYLDRGIVPTYRRSYSLSTWPDDQNSLTLQYDDTNNAYRDPLHGLVQEVNFSEFLSSKSHIIIHLVND